MTATYLPEEEQDMKDLADLVRKKTNSSRKFQFIPADLTKESVCQAVVQKHLDHFGGQLDTLICNHGNQNAISDITDLDTKQWLDTFDTNIHPFFYLTKAAIPHLEKSPTRQPTIVFNDSINAFKGHSSLVDYTSTKGAILGFARSLNAQLTGKTGIRINCTSEFLSSRKLVSLISLVLPFRCCPWSDLDSVDVRLNLLSNLLSLLNPAPTVVHRL